MMVDQGDNNVARCLESRKEEHRVIAKANLFEVKTDGLYWGLGLRVVVALFVLGALGLTQHWISVSFGALWVGMNFYK